MFGEGRLDPFYGQPLPPDSSQGGAKGLCPRGEKIEPIEIDDGVCPDADNRESQGAIAIVPRAAYLKKDNGSSTSFEAGEELPQEGLDTAVRADGIAQDDRRSERHAVSEKSPAVFRKEEGFVRKELEMIERAPPMPPDDGPGPGERRRRLC